MNIAVTDWIDNASGPQKAQLQELRQIIFDVAPHAKEQLKWGQPCYSQNALFCYLARSKANVKIGFQQGSKLTDPTHALCGDGKQMRHLKFSASDLIDEEVCRSLVLEAIEIDNTQK